MKDKKILFENTPILVQNSGKSFWSIVTFKMITRATYSSLLTRKKNLFFFWVGGVAAFVKHLIIHISLQQRFPGVFACDTLVWSEVLSLFLNIKCAWLSVTLSSSCPTPVTVSRPLWFVLWSPCEVPTPRRNSVKRTRSRVVVIVISRGRPVDPRINERCEGGLWAPAASHPILPITETQVTHSHVFGSWFVSLAKT